MYFQQMDTVKAEKACSLPRREAYTPINYLTFIGWFICLNISQLNRFAQQT